MRREKWLCRYYLDLRYLKFTFVGPKHQQGVNNHHIVSWKLFLDLESGKGREHHLKKKKKKIASVCRLALPN